MQTKKILVVALSLALVALALPTTNINKAHAFTSGNNSFSISNVTTNFASPNGQGSGTVAQSASTVTVTVTIQASNFNNPAYQRNVTVGFKGDWMSQYQNASVMTLTMNQIGSTTISVALPSVNALSPNHSWNIEVWDSPLNTNVAACQGNDSSEQYRGSGSANACFSLSSGSVSILTSDQYAAAESRNIANTLIGSINLAGVTNSAAQAQLAQASAELSLGDQSWRGGDFSSAKTHYQNSQNDANSALATAYNLNGGSQNASIVQAIMQGTGYVLIGIGILLGGFGAFMYFRRRPKV
jgi:hypothetical protein